MTHKFTKNLWIGFCHTGTCHCV